MFYPPLSGQLEELLGGLSGLGVRDEEDPTCLPLPREPTNSLCLLKPFLKFKPSHQWMQEFYPLPPTGQRWWNIYILLEFFLDYCQNFY